MKKILLSGDHNGIELKSHIISYLKGRDFECIDLGPFEQDGKVDYPDYSVKLSKMINDGEAQMGILICGTGQGCNMVANKFPNVRAALVHNIESAGLSRDHNDSNVLCLGSWITPKKRTEQIIDSWLNTKFGEGRHTPRVRKISTAYSTDFAHDKKKVVFTNGVFDILNKGHIELLKFAKGLGDKLVVAINSDRAVKEFKGPDRPVNSEQERKDHLEAIKYVDEVVIFDDIKTQEIVNTIKPHIIVKGGEWTEEEVRQRDKVPTDMDIRIFPLVKDYSTTSTLNKIQEKGEWNQKKNWN